MREPGESRRRRILAAVRSRGTVRLSELAAELEVSVITVRRDVAELARSGRLRRGHGVARAAEAAPGPAAGAPAPPAGCGAVALVVPEHHDYLREIMRGARDALHRAGLRVALHIAPREPGAEAAIAGRALADGARGLLLAPRWRTAADEAADHSWLARLTVPTVLMERRPAFGGALAGLDSVCSDHAYGARLAVDHLVALGHRRIVLAARDDSPTARALRAAFAALAAARPEIEDWAVLLSSPGSAAGPDGAAGTPGAAGPGPLASAGFAALLRERAATAAVLHGDVDALMLVQQLADDGIRVPHDCSVVAYDDVVGALGSPPLTAVAPPKAEVGRVAAELLVRRLTDREAGAVQRIELLPALEERGSARRRIV